MDNNGEFMLLNAGYEANSAHTVFVTNSKRDGEITRPNQYWSQGISWFGGLYIDKSNSNVSWGTQYKYYGDKFSNQTVFPMVGEKDSRGRFKVTTATNIIKYKFDGGKLTINTLSKQEITDTYVLVGDYQGSWNNQDNNHKFSDDHYTKTISLTLAQNATGIQDKGANGKWFRFKGCKWDDWYTQFNRSNTVLLGDDDVIDKNNSLGDEDDRILVKAPYTNNVYTFTYFKIDDKNYLQIEVEEASETPHTGDKFYIMGSHNSWCKNCEEHKMTVVDGEYAYKTYENITDNWDFKVAKEDGTELGWSYFSQSKSDYTCSEVPATISNIRPNSYSGAKNLTIYWDGSNVYVHVEDYVAPITTYTVTLHPNNGGASTIVRENVPEGSNSSALNLSAITYGTGTATWYTNEACTEPFTSVTGDMHLYAKWGVSGNYYIVGCLQTASDGGDSGNWSNDLSRQMTYESGSSGKCSFTFVAPAGKYPFEIIKNKSWSEKINSGNYDGMFDNSISDVTLSASHGHLMFELASPKKVTVSYNGKVSVKVEDYSFDNSKTWRIKTSWDTGEGEWHYNTVMTNNGTTNATAILRNVSGTRSFIISTKTNDNDAQAVIGNETFNALYVDMTSPSTGLTWNTSSAKRDGSDNFNSTTPQADGNYWRNCKFTLAEQSDIRISFDGGKIRCDILPKYTVTFNSNGGSEVASQTMFEGRTASEPADPTKSGFKFEGWQRSGADYNFNTPVTANITLDAVWTPVWTVSFNTGGGTTIDPQYVENGQTAIRPDDPEKPNHTFNYWELNSTEFDFTTAITANTELVASWTYAPAPISSVSISQAAIYTWESDEVYTLVGSVVPADIEGATLSWSSNAESVVTVDDGVISVVGPGTANVTFSARDYYGTELSKTCVVTVAPCEKQAADAPKYSATITGFNTVDGDATLDGLWDESNDNTEPATIRIVKLKLSNNNYVYDDNGTVKMSTDASLATAQWYEIPTGETYSPNWTGSSFALYEFKNVSTGNYMRRGNGRYGDNGAWFYYTTLADSRTTDGNQYKFFYDNTMGTHLVCREGADYNEGQTINELKKAFAIHNNNLNWPDGYSGHCAAPMVICGYTNDPGGNTYTKLHETVVVDPSYPNPAYIYSQMNGSYYRMKENATVTANCGALAQPDIIRVELYADAATSVKLTKIDETEVCTIALAANEEKVFTYIVTDGSLLDGETAYVIKAMDSHAAIRSVAVTSFETKNPATPDLHWTTTPVREHLLLDGNFTYTAASSDSQGAISYASGNTNIAQVDSQTGEVTPVGANTTTISATIAADECHAANTISYEVSFLGLQDYINTESVTNVTLPGDFTSENIVINKAITIDGNNHAIGNLTVQTRGDLTLSGALTVQDFTICTNAGNSEHPALSGQVRNATNLTANGNAYFLYTVDPSGHVQYGWYDFTVPFRVDVMTGIAGIQNETLNEDFVNERDYAIMEHLGEKQANGEYSYKKFRGVMQPNKLYSITLDNRDNYNTVRFKKTNDGGALVADDNVTLNEHSSSEAKRANWNGVGNGTLHHANANLSSAGYIQIYQSGDKTFKTYNKNDISLVVGTAFMVQQEGGTMILNQASHGELRAPARQSDDQRPAISIQIAREGKPFSDQLFITANEDAQPTYTPGVDVAKAGNIGNVNVPQIWTNAYDTKLCVHEAQLINGEAPYALSLYAPADGTYTLTGLNIPEDYTLYLTYNGRAIWNLSISETYALDLIKGINSEYGLMIVESYKTPTGMEEISSQPAVFRKILRNGILYILHNGKIYNAQGAEVK